MKHDIVIEKITSLNQLEKCAEIYPEAYNAEPWNDNWTYETAKALLTCYYNTPDFKGWAAIANNKIIGCAIGNVEPYYSGNIFILKELFVSANMQEAGIGSSLLAVMKQTLGKMNIKMIILSTYRSIFNFYKKSGFEEMEEVGTMKLLLLNSL